jgi:hypothetical protein
LGLGSRACGWSGARGCVCHGGGGYGDGHEAAQALKMNTMLLIILMPLIKMMMILMWSMARGTRCLLEALRTHLDNAALLPFILDALASLIVGNESIAHEVSGG